MSEIDKIVAEYFEVVDGRICPDWRSITEAEFRSALTRAAEGRWEPIETAPKDGTEILIRYPLQGNVKELARWNAIYNCWLSKGKHIYPVEQKCEWHSLPADLPTPPTD